MFYVAIVQNESIAALYTYNTYEEALAVFHTELAYRAEDRISTKCAILNNDLMLLRQEIYTAPGESPSEVVTPTEGE